MATFYEARRSAGAAMKCAPGHDGGRVCRACFYRAVNRDDSAGSRLIARMQMMCKGRRGRLLAKLKGAISSMCPRREVTARNIHVFLVCRSYLHQETSEN